LTTALHALSAFELQAHFRSGALSPVEVAQAVLARMERWEPALNATWVRDAETALDQAQASEARWQSGEPLSLLDGVPVSLKENLATEGLVQPLGCAATPLAPALQDCPPAARLREAGAVFVARTTMPDWGMLSSGVSSYHGITRNPWDLDKNPGGSSSGAAAAAAAGYGPLHLGTDIGGSIRLPASWCGVVGFKPSLGRIPIKPPYAGRVAGPICRTVADVALAMSVLSRPDWRDATSLPSQDIDWASLWSADFFAPTGPEARPQGALRWLQERREPLRIGVCLDAGWGDAPSASVIAAVQAAALALEAAGARVEPIGPVSTRSMVQGLDRFWRMRSWLDFKALPPERQALVLPYIRDWIAAGERLSAPEVFRGYSQIAALRDAAVAATQAFDFVISPVSPGVAFPAEQCSPLNDPERPFEHIAFTLPWNMSEQPAISLNADLEAGSGLPIGLQIIGRRHDDLGVLKLAAAWEALRPTQHAWPEPPDSV
jgi:Asp-tRNA(Asn)/Glu-tRNA(Gln) amidotransferase A subunit family amidase